MVVLAATIAVCCGRACCDDRPNIVVILADDLGYGDLGCYGSTKNQTPNIDRLAAGGLRCTDFHSNGPMCSPTRAALLTGCYPQRFGRPFERALSPQPSRDIGLPLQAVTLAEVLKRSGYATGMFGKWHLGYRPPRMPVNQGFDRFRGLVSGDGDHHTQIDRSGNQDWWRNNRIEMERGYTADLVTRHSIDFIQRHQSEPFFLYVAHLAIHFPWQGPTDPPHRVQGNDYSRDKWGIVPDRKNVAKHVKAMVESLDQSVGRLIAALEQLGIEEKTLVVFASDNGGYLDYASGGFENISSNGPLRGQKGSVHEGGHRVPGVFYWPGRIPAGAVTDETVLTMDFYPTFAQLADAPLPAHQRTDGIDLAPLLFHTRPLAERAVCWRIGEHGAIRQGPWKLNLGNREGPQLYNLKRDLGETVNVAPKHPELVSSLTAAYQAWEADVDRGFAR
jgi:arylsulfatase A-like enzyme